MHSQLPVALLVVTVGIGCDHAPPTGQPQPLSLEAAPAPRRVETVDDFVRTINDNPDLLHFDYTPSVHKLIKVGERAIPQMLNLMLSEDRDTRLRAERVLSGITLEQHGFVFGQGWKDEKGAERFRAFWSSLGDLDWTATQEERTRAVKLWREWIAKKSPTSE